MAAQLGLVPALPAQKTIAISPSAEIARPSSIAKSTPAPTNRNPPPRVLAAHRFLAHRGVAAGHRAVPRSLALRNITASVSLRSAHPSPQVSGDSSPASSTMWTPLGPIAISTANFNLVSGRVTSIAIDPSDTTGNHVYIGTTGGGVWSSNNAGSSTITNIVFNPLTDTVTTLGSAEDASISIGALTVQPGGTGVILAGTGDPNDVLDSYYGAGILRSTDNGATWSLIWKASDIESGSGTIDASFVGLGFAGFAWCSPQNAAAPQCTPQTVVAAVADSYEGEVVDATVPAENCEGLYYSTDGGATWHIATIEDDAADIVQSATAPLMGPNGNAATSVVWNPVRQLFIAAVRFHGYYASPDGITWTRLAYQPGAGLVGPNNTNNGQYKIVCPTNPKIPGSEDCHIYRGALAVNPVTGDTFAWTVDLSNIDQGIWQDQCALNNLTNLCTNTAISFGQQWNTAALQDPDNPGIISDGKYTLALAAVPSASSSTGSLVLAGADDLWEATAPYSLGGSWRNATNSTTCMSAQVGEYQHALAWSPGNPAEVFIGNDSGLWRSMDGVAESGSQCSSSDASHFQNLNGSLGSLAEVESLSVAPANPYELLAGLGVNGAAGIDESANTFTPDWPQVLTGIGGPVAIDPMNNGNWYVNDWYGVAIDLCTQATGCAPSAFATNSVVTEADVDNDGEAMSDPATFLIDPVDNTQLLVATCRVWRGPANGSLWTQANAISPVLAFLNSSTPAASCDGNAMVRSMAAMSLGNGKEIVYVGMYGANDFEGSGSNLPGHVLSGLYAPDPTTGVWAWTWTDLTLNPVTNDVFAFNAFALGISSITIDPHDPTGNTIYVTVEGMPQVAAGIRVAYRRTTDGGAHWASIASNLPIAPASSLAIDPQSANTVYVATDVGVYYTAEVASCAGITSNCWAAFGTGLPAAPAVALSTPSVSSPDQALIVATYGRGIWQAPLWTSQEAIADATAVPANIAFTYSPAVGVASQPAALALDNIGSLPLTVTSILMRGADPGDFSETDNCQVPPAANTVAAGGSCNIKVTFTPQVANVERTAVMTIYANVYGGQITVDLTGTGTVATGTVTLSAYQLPFSQIEVGSTSAPQWITLTNTSATAALAISNITATSPFLAPQSGNSCGASLAPDSSCSVEVEFAPVASGSATGTLIFTDTAGTQTVNLSGSGAAAPTDILTPATLTFPATAIGQSGSLNFTITNNGDLTLTNLAVTLTNNPGGQFQLSNACGSEVAAEHPGTCTVTVTFAPSQVSTFTGSVTVTDTTTKLDTQTVSLSAQGVATPVFQVTPASLTFTSQQPGPQTVTITNQGATLMTNIALALSPASASSEYSISSACGTALSAGKSCTAQVTLTSSFAPAATLTISSSTPDVQPVSIPIDALVASPSQLAFSQVTVGQTSAAQTVTITNGTGSALSSLSVNATTPFTVAQNGCTGSLAVSANCTVSVAFTPTVSGTVSGALTVSSGAGGASAAVPLSGTGIPISGSGFSFTVAFQGSSSMTVAAGQTANYALIITPSGGSGTFTFSCGTLPTDALCLFSPPTQTLNSGVQGNVQAEISTTAAQAARSDGPVHNQPGSRRMLPLVCSFVLLPFVFRRRRIVQLALLAMILFCEVSSCTSSGSTGGSCTGDSCGQHGGQGTPAGTYTIPVTVTANGLSQTVDVVLTVD